MTPAEKIGDYPSKAERDQVVINTRLSSSAVALVAFIQKLFPKLSADEAYSFLWTHSAFPCYGDEAAFYMEQLLAVKKTIDGGKTPCDFCAEAVDERFSPCLCPAHHFDWETHVMKRTAISQVGQKRSKLSKLAEKKGWVLNPDSNLVNVIVLGMVEKKNKFGAYYCPCRLDNTAENICPCKSAEKDIEEKGHCHCELFFSKRE